MLARSAAFDQAIRNGGIVQTACAIQRGGVTIAQLDLMPGATIHLDDQAASRRTFSGQLPNTGIAPHLATDTLAPFTIEAAVSSGFKYPNGTSELLPLGLFVVDVVKDDTAGLISISGPDRAFKIATNWNVSPYVIAAGTPLDTAILGYLDAKYPGMVLIADGAAHGQVLASTAVYQAGQGSGDPWSNCQALAAKFGRELFMDNLGRAVLRLVPDPTQQPAVWQYVPGTANLALSGTHTMDTSQGVYNAALVSAGGSGVATPVSSLVQITNTSSPIFPDPKGFGMRPAFLTSSQLTTAAQCTAAGQALLNRQPGIFDQFDFTAIPHPAHEPGDVAVYASQLLGVSIPLVLAAWDLQIDLQAPAQYQTRTAGAVSETILVDSLNATLQ